MLRSDYKDIKNFVFNESPTKITDKQFETDFDYKSGTLKVFLNGIKEIYITENTSRRFSFDQDTKVNDSIEVEYKKN